MQTKSYNLLSKKLNLNKHKIGIIGLGYVGLPLVKKFLQSGCKKIFGVDNDKKKIKLLQNGKSPIESLKIKYFQKNYLQISTSYSILRNVDIIIICLPTPLKSKNKPDLSYLNNCYKNLSKIYIKNKIIILESTVYPGVTRKLANKIVLSNNKLEIGKNIFFGYSPERENPGDKKFSYYKTPKVISGYTALCLKLVKLVYKNISKKTFSCNTLEEAETSKLLENLYRSINIGLVNEMKIICDKLNIDVQNVIEAAATKNFGFQKFNPGPGLGGHCIPIDPYYLSWISKKKGYDPIILKSSAKINNNMPKIITNKILKFFNKKPKILIFGISYKKNVDDDRESPSFEFMKIFKKKKINFDVIDPFFNEIKIGRQIKFKKKLIKLGKINFKDYDCALIVTDHDKFDYNFIKNNFKLIFDCRGVYKSKKIFGKNIIQV
jgi:UDP-N-acetyl-D-glucosamine dehydrogenase